VCNRWGCDCTKNHSVDEVGMTLTKADIEVFKGLIAEVKPADCSEDIEAIVKVQTRQIEQIDNIIKTVDKMVVTIYGNGKPGLVTTVTGLVSAMGILKWIGITLGGSIIVFIWAVITHSVEIIH
jgi:hypothetical protein